MLTFHHIGIACRDIEKTKAFYLQQGYTATPTVDDPLQHVRISFLNKEGAPQLELLEPLDEQNPVARTLATAGVTPYHMCYEVRDLESAIAELRTQRFLLVNGPVPACALENRRIAFMFQKNTGLIELVESHSQ
jgi:methylmalonyl-CoA/ethylmalonyl-CoA epimerase